MRCASAALLTATQLGCTALLGIDDDYVLDEDAGAGGAGAGGGPSCTTTQRFGNNTSDDVSSVVRDTYLDDSDESANFGTSDDLYSDEGPETRVALLRIDLSSLPVGATVCAATLRLHLGTNDSSEEQTFHEVLEEWQQGEATWQDRMANVAWGAQGCAEPTSCAAAEVGSVTPEGADDRSFDIPLSVALVQRWVSNAAVNLGMAIKCTGGEDGVIFRSSDHDDGLRPSLEITYDP